MKTPKPVSFGRHRKKCAICRHEKVEQIEADFVAWRSPATMVIEYGLVDRSSIYRHAHAACLFEKRKRNIKAALENMIERSADVELTASAVVSAIQAYSKINAAGQWIERTETVNLKDLFDRMTTKELEAYARDGALPAWFPASQSYSAPDSNTGGQTE